MAPGLDIALLGRLLLASLLGALIGLERECHGRPAGFRTHLFGSQLLQCLNRLAEVKRVRVE